MYIWDKKAFSEGAKLTKKANDSDEKEILKGASDILNTEYENENDKKGLKKPDEASDALDINQ